MYRAGCLASEVGLDGERQGETGPACVIEHQQVVERLELLGEQDIQPRLTLGLLLRCEKYFEERSVERATRSFSCRRGLTVTFVATDVNGDVSFR